MRFYVTYGGNTYQSDSYSVIESPDYDGARAIVEKTCGNRFAFIYDEAGWMVPDGNPLGDDLPKITQAERYGLYEIPLQRQMRRELGNVLPTKFPTAQDHEANLPRTEGHDYSSALPKDSEPGRMNKPAEAGAHISDKVYLMPESFNALRREMDENWPALFRAVGWFMAFDAVRFIEAMDGALDTKTTFDSEKVDAICKKYLNLLRNKRGLSSII